MTTSSDTKPEKVKRKAGAQPGNKHALGCKTSGRPPIWDPVYEAQYMLEWIKDPDHFIFNELYAERGYCPQRASEWAKQYHEFAEAYNKAKLTLAGRRERMVHSSLLEKSTFNRLQGMYDKHLVAFERDEKEFDARLRAKVEAEITCKPEEKARHDAIMEQIKALQGNQGPSDAKSAEKSNNTDNKSA